MSILDTTVVNVAINTLAREFDTPLTTIQWVVDRLHARAGDGDPAHRLGRRPLRHQAPVHDLDRRSSSRGSVAVRHRLVGRVADRLPRPAGPRRRHDHAGRHDDPHAGRRPAARRPRDERHRRPDAARPDPRPDPRRLARRRRLLALDLLHQPADRRSPRCARRARSSPRDMPQPARALRRARPRCCSRPAWRCSSTAWRSRAAAGGFGSRRGARARRSPASSLLAAFVWHALRTTDAADRPAPVRQPHVRGRLGDARPVRSIAVFGVDAAAAALLPGRARRVRAAARACCSPRRASARCS